MKKRIKLIIVLTLILTGFFFQIQSAFALRAPLEDSGAQTISFSVDVSANELTIEKLVTERGDYSIINLPGFELAGNPGEPWLPAVTKNIGIPFDAEYQLTVQGYNPKTIDLGAPVLPKASQVFLEEDYLFSSPESSPAFELEYIEDEILYRTDAFLPGTLGEIGNDGIMRSQRILSILLYPVQYNPVSQKLIVYEKMEVELSLTSVPNVGAAEIEAETGSFEKFFADNLLNYEQAQEWRRPSTEITENKPSVSNRPPTGVWTPPEHSLRIKVLNDGMYQITYNELVNAGMGMTGLDPRKLQLWYRGEEMAIKVLGEEDGVFDSTDKIVFFGEGEINNKYSKYNTYWLFQSSSNGKRMATRNVAPGSAAQLTNYDNPLRIEQNFEYLARYAGDDDLERYRGTEFKGTAAAGTGNITIGRWTKNIDLLDVADGSGRIRMVLVGGNNMAELAPDHHAEIWINGTKLGDVSWDGIYVNAEVTLDIPTGILLEGSNTIEITLPVDNQVDPNDHTKEKRDIVFFDYFEMTAKTGFTASGSKITFTASATGRKKVTVKEITGSNIFGADLTNKDAQVELTGYTRAGSEITFEDNFTGAKKYWFGDQSSLNSVSSMVSDNYSNLSSSANQADWIIISHSTFMDQAQTLANWRQNHGLNTMVVDLQDVYDEFGYGNDTAYAIREFLSHAYYQWVKPAPSYVVLMGDGHYDPKNYLGNNRPLFIPPFLRNVDPLWLENATDNSFVLLAGDDSLPDMMIGRLSVNSVSEAQAVVSKIISYESDQSVEVWKRVVTDMADKAGTAGNFPAMSYFLIEDELPESYHDVNRSIYYQITHPDLASTRAAMINSFNEGSLVFNYIGHANNIQYGNDMFFRTNDLPLLNNSDRLSINVIMSCLEGYFIHPRRPGTVNYVDSLGEQFVRYANGGAVASWSSAGNAVATGHDYLDRGFFRGTFTNRVQTVGEAVQTGLLRLWSHGRFQDLLYTYHLFGDPATRIQRTLVANPDNFLVQYNTPFVFSQSDLSANDDFPPDSTFSIEIESQPSHGTLTDNGNGNWTYTPNPGYVGMDSFEYSLNDGINQSNTTTVYFRVRLVDNYLPLIFYQ